MTSFLRANKGATAVLGSARNDFVINAMCELSKDGANICAVVRQERLEPFKERGFKAYGFSGGISWLNLSVLLSLRKINPDRIIIVVGDQFLHFNVFGALDVWMKTGLLKKAPMLISYSFAPGRLVPWRGANQSGNRASASVKTSGKARMRFHIIEAVWGREYIDSFLNVSLPNLLTPGNLAAIASKTDCVFKIYTTSKDAEVIVNNHFFKQAGQLMDTEIISMDHLFNTHGHSVPISLLLMTQCHKLAVESAAGHDAALIFLSPDAVFTEGALDKVLQAALSGKRVFMTAVLRVCKESFIPRFVSRFRDDKSHFPASPRAILKLAFDSLHPIMNNCFIESDKFTKAPANLFWRVKEEGVLVRGLYLHPLMVYPRNSNATPLGAIDTDYLINACPDYSDYHVVTDSDEMAVVEFSAEEKRYDLNDTLKFNILRYADYIGRWGNKIHHHLLKEKIRYHTHDLSPSWHGVEKESDKVINRALALKIITKIRPRFVA